MGRPALLNGGGHVVCRNDLRRIDMARAVPTGEQRRGSDEADHADDGFAR